MMVSAFEPPKNNQRLDNASQSPIKSKCEPFLPLVSCESENEDEEVKMNCIGGVQPYMTTDKSDNNYANEEEDNSLGM